MGKCKVTEECGSHEKITVKKLYFFLLRCYLCSFPRGWLLYEKPYKTYSYGSTRANVVEEYSLVKTDL